MPVGKPVALHGRGSAREPGKPDEIVRQVSQANLHLRSRQTDGASAPAYFEEKAASADARRSDATRCIRTRWPSGGRYLREFALGSETLSIDVPGVLTLDEPTLMREAAMAGAGSPICGRHGSHKMALLVV